MLWKETINLNKSSVLEPKRLTPEYAGVQKETPTDDYQEGSVEKNRIWELREGDQAKETGKKDRAGTGFQIFLYTLAGLFDLVPIILNLFVVGVGVNRIITVVGWGVFFMIMRKKGLKYETHKDLYGSLLLMSTVEFVPVVDILPLWCRVAYKIISTLEAEDGTTHGISKAVGATQKISQLRKGRVGKPKTPKVPSAVK